MPTQVLRCASVVVPAHQEEHAVAGLLGDLVAQQLAGLRLEVAVVVNGSTDATAAVARSFAGVFAAAGHSLTVVESELASKQRALNDGDALVDAYPRLYLDADAGLAPDAVRRVVEVLAAVDEPRLAAPTIAIGENPSRIARSYGRVWSEMPYIRVGVAGVGFYAVNEAGRRRWGLFPDDVRADDKFVRLQFQRSESVVVADTSFTVHLPRDVGELMAVRARWNALNAELRKAYPGLVHRDRRRRVDSIRHLGLRPQLWAAAPGFLLVWAGAWPLTWLRRWGIGDGWTRATSSPRRDPSSASVVSEVERDDGGGPETAVT